MPTDTIAVVRAAAEGKPRADSTDCQVHTRPFLTAPRGNPQIVISGLCLRLEELERRADRDEGAQCDENRALARETLERHALLAGRMGMPLLRQQLEDASFRILAPLVYQELARRVAPNQAEDEMCLTVLRTSVHCLLEENGIVARVQGRIKGLYSLYRKLCRLNCPLGSIMDRIGLRVIVPSIAECYQVLGLLQVRFCLVPGTFDDYIAHPKANGYRSLHACFYPVPALAYKPIEFQLRTLQMHHEAEFGMAAHWRYKSEETVSAKEEAKLVWLRGLLEEREQPVDHAAFIRQLCRQAFGERPEISGEDRQAAQPQPRESPPSVPQAKEGHTGESTRASEGHFNQVSRSQSDIAAL